MRASHWGVKQNSHKQETCVHSLKIVRAGFDCTNNDQVRYNTMIRCRLPSKWANIVNNHQLGLRVYTQRSMSSTSVKGSLDTIQKRRKTVEKKSRQVVILGFSQQTPSCPTPSLFFFSFPMVTRFFLPNSKISSIFFSPLQNLGDETHKLKICP